LPYFLKIGRSWPLSEFLRSQILSTNKFLQRSQEESIFWAELNIFSSYKQEKIILAPQTSADKDDASATNVSATRATGRQRRHQRDVVNGAIATRATTPAVLSGHEGGGGRRSADVVLPVAGAGGQRRQALKGK
jgi:hypothetical protein